ncbi:hypothetical protein ABFS83_04G177000 [Erythranthe nasuta]
MESPSQYIERNFLLTPLFISSILIVLLLKYLSNKNPTLKYTSHKHIPGPIKLPIIGNLHQLIGKHPHLILNSLAKKYGPVLFLQLGEVPTVVLSSPQTAKEALKTHDLALATRPEIFAAKILFYNCSDIAFSPYGPHWRHVRKISTLELLSVKRVQSYGFVREEEVSRLLQRVLEHSSSSSSYPNKTINLTKLLNLYANDVLCRIVFGKDFSVDGEYERLGFQEMLNEYQELLGGFALGDFFPSMEVLMHTLTGNKARLVKAFKRFDRLFNDVIEERLRMKSDCTKEKKDFVDILLEIHHDEDAEMPLTMDNVKALLLDMFAAGTDTTFIVLDWGMTELVTNPSVLKKLQTEVRKVVGQKKFVSENDLPQLPYMKAVIKEIYRLHPPAPVLVPHESMQEVTIGGFTIPEKTRIFVNAWAVGRDPETWSHPDRFDPDRFVDSDVDFKGKDFELIPFGAGRRSCPAIAFGSATVEIALAQLVHSFDWKLPDGIRAVDLDMEEVFGITMHRKSPLEVVAKPYFTS